jgi:transposase
MEAIVERCCGLDVHQASVVACLLVSGAGKRPRKQVRSFGTMMGDLLALRDWLIEEGCTHVAMESTGVYWMPVYSALEGAFTLIVGNATHIKNVPGRKTDVKDSEWLADLCRHGLIRPSFVPPPALRELRDLTRYRRKLVESHTTEGNRLHRLLETANIKITSVLSELLGVSGRLMLRALIDGSSTPAQMANLAKRRLRKKMAQLERALEGRVTEHHRFLLGMQLDRVEQVERDIAKLDERINAQMTPYQEQLAHLMQIPGVDWVVATTIIAELGVDMSVFPTAQHAAAWTGVCPGNNESGGRRKRQPARRGNVHLTTALVQAAVCASRTKGSYLKEKYWRLAARRGPNRAAMAVAHKILVAAYHMLARGIAYHDLGGGYLDKLSAGRTTTALVKRLEKLGFKVTLEQLQETPDQASVENSHEIAAACG